MIDPMDASADGSYDLPDVLTVTQRQLADAEDRAARAIAQSVHAQRTIDQLRKRVLELHEVIQALEEPGPEADRAAG